MTIIVGTEKSAAGFELTPSGGIWCERSAHGGCSLCGPVRDRWKAFWAGAGVLPSQAFVQARRSLSSARELVGLLERGGWPADLARQWLAEAEEMVALVEPYREGHWRMRLAAISTQTYVAREYDPHWSTAKARWIWWAGRLLVDRLQDQPINRTLAERMSHVTGIGMGAIHGRPLAPVERQLLGIDPLPEQDYRSNEMLPEDYYA